METTYTPKGTAYSLHSIQHAVEVLTTILPEWKGAGTPKELASTLRLLLSMESAFQTPEMVEALRVEAIRIEASKRRHPANNGGKLPTEADL